MAMLLAGLGSREAASMAARSEPDPAEVAATVRVNFLVTPAELIAIPYYAWANRTPGDMRIWIPER
jgi:DUF1680 family protein